MSSLLSLWRCQSAARTPGAIAGTLPQTWGVWLIPQMSRLGQAMLGDRGQALVKEAVKEPAKEPATEVVSRLDRQAASPAHARPARRPRAPRDPQADFGRRAGCIRRKRRRLGAFASAVHRGPHRRPA